MLKVYKPKPPSVGATPRKKRIPQPVNEFPSQSISAKRRFTRDKQIIPDLNNNKNTVAHAKL